MKLTMPLALAPEAVTMFQLRDRLNGGAIVPDAAITGLETAMRGAEELMQRVVVLAGTKDPAATVDGHALKVRDVAVAAAEQAARKLDAAREAAQNEINRLQAETAAPPPPRDPHAVQLEAEIRARLASMKDKERGETIAKAIKDGDDLVVGSFLRGPAMLTGVGEHEREMRRHAWRSARFPDKVDREQRLQKAIAAVDRGGRAMIAMVQEIADRPEVKLATANKQRADAALAALAQPQE
ncbi:MAG: hypothetical protein E5V75_24015 [Mesorhizobium sp.]|nr:MAG: hypothetical protein E5V75_24015 [Mesorhizobium sp.]